jgi:UDP:flavonoid glycosyltransferase YjiC (YdhE family)
MISFVVCGNGYGHLKRVLSVVNEILNINTEQPITLFCNENHMRFAKGEINFKSNTTINFDSSLSENEISWIESESFREEKYRKWERDLARNRSFQSSTLIVSDNHILPARMHRNSLLMGSFLWHDVTIVNSPDIEKIKLEEASYLIENRPALICVNDMVMPGLIDFTTPIKLPWFCTKYQVINILNKNNRFLVTGGGTELINAYLLNLIEIVSLDNLDKTFFLDSKLFQMCSFHDRANIELFEFGDEHFASLSGVICRPGVGILTDCVRYDLPSIVLNDAYNLEIEHNANCVNRLMIGESFDSKDVSVRKLSDKVSELINNVKYLENFTSHLRELQTGGAMRAAEFILQKLAVYE